MKAPGEARRKALAALHVSLVLAILLAGAWTMRNALRREKLRETSERRQQEERIREALFRPDAPPAERSQSVAVWAARGPEALPRLTEALEHDEALVRRGAVLALGQMGADAGPAIPSLLRRLTDPAPKVRAGAILALRNLGQAEKIVPELADRLASDADVTVRENAAEALQGAGGDLLQHLAPALRSEHADSRRLTLDLLSPPAPASGGATIPTAEDTAATVQAIRPLLRDPDPVVRAKAHQIISRAGQLSLDEAAAAVRDPADEVGLVGLTVLGRRAGDATPHAEEIIRLLERLPARDVAGTQNSMGRPLREVAMETLGAIGAPAREAVPQLLRIHRDGECRTRFIATETLIRVGGDETVIVEALEDLLRDADCAGPASRLLSGYAPEAAAALSPRLVERLRHPEVKARVAAARALSGIRTAPREAIPALIEVLQDADPTVRQSAAAALGDYGAEAADAVPALIAEVERQEPEHAWWAVRALGEIGPAAGEAVPLLVRIAREKVPPSGDVGGDSMSVDRRRGAIDALGRIGEARDDVLDALRDAAGDPNESLRSSAIHALGVSGAAPDDVLPWLRAALSDRSSGVRSAAARALGTTRGDPDGRVEALRRALGDPDWWVRRSAVISLGKLSGAADSAIPDLRRLLDDPEGGRMLTWPDPLDVPTLTMEDAETISFRDLVGRIIEQIESVARRPQRGSD